MTISSLGNETLVAKGTTPSQGKYFSEYPVEGALAVGGLFLCCLACCASWRYVLRGLPKSSNAMSALQRGYARDMHKTSERCSLTANESAWQKLLNTWDFLAEHNHKYSKKQRQALVKYLNQPQNWCITWSALQSMKKFNVGCQKSMHDVVAEILMPMCENYGAPSALVMNSWKVSEVDGFVVHCWKEGFEDFMESLRKTYCSHNEQPNLFICAFVVFQKSMDTVSEIFEHGLENSPFAKTLREAKHVTLIHNDVADVYERGWCLIELIYAYRLGFFPSKVKVVGQNMFADELTNISDLQCTRSSDQKSISKAIFDFGDPNTMNAEILQIRSICGSMPASERRLPPQEDAIPPDFETLEPPHSSTPTTMLCGDICRLDWLQGPVTHQAAVYKKQPRSAVAGCSVNMIGNV